MSRITLSFLLTAGLLPAAVSEAQWSSVHRDNTNNGVVDMAATVLDVTGGPTVSSPDEGIASSARPIIDGTRVYTVFMDDGGTALDPSDDVLRIKAHDLTTLDVVWTSPDLDTGNSVSFGSASAQVIVDGGTTSTLVYGSGQTVHALDTADGSPLWATTLDDTTTSPTNAAYDLINASPVFGEGRIYINTYYDSFGAPDDLSQIVALDATTGSVDWFQVTGGRGQAGPLFFDEGVSDAIVIVNVPGGLRAFRADDGQVVWSHDDPALPGGAWTVEDEFWTEPIIADGSLFTITYNFGGTNANLVRVNPATGELDWINDASVTLTSDSPLIHVGSPARLYAVGGPFGDASLVLFDPATGSEIDRVPLGFGVFRNYMAATNDRLYLAANGVRVFDLDGALQSAYTTGGISSSISLGSDGTLHMVSGGQLHRFENTTSVSDWLMLD
ncbi:MAG: PQQ-binding-like beta-propeller repeat protein [Candidatus Sumerlaeia bacterium]|nr:PQQ-binding-like beta-propeller repeat protein [Candidatus Sumerlaeia bacterium]